MERARQEALPEFREQLELLGFTPEHPMRAYSVYDGDLFDLAGREIEAVYMDGYSPGGIALLYCACRALFSGDACKGNTLWDGGLLKGRIA